MKIEEERIYYYEPAFLQENPLTKDTVLIYFSYSPFYDKQCINEILRMQFQTFKIDIKQYINKINGKFYELDEEHQKHNANLFIIYKKEHNNGKIYLLKAYYIMFGYIYVCPSIDLISDDKLVKILWQFNSLLDIYVNYFETNNEFLQTQSVEKKSIFDEEFLIETVNEFVKQ